MALIPYVLPGQVIRSKDFNALIDEVNALQTGAPGAGVTVPDVFGLALAQARAVLTQPSVNLAVGSVFDAFGTAINPNSSAVASRVVLGQAPPAATRVTVGSSVNLTVAGTGQGGGTLPIGDLFVGDGQGPGGNITQNGKFVFKFPVTAVVTLAEKYNLKAVVVGQSHASEWKARAVTGTAPNLQDLTEITIPAAPPPNGTTVEVQVELTVPDNTDGTTAVLTLEVTSQRNASISDTSNAVQILVGSSLPTPQKITVQFQSVTNGIPQSDGTVTVQSPKSRITYQAHVPTAGPRTYDVTFDAPLPTGFAPTLVGGTETTAGSKVLPFRIDVVKTPGSAPGTLKIRVTDQNDAQVFGTFDQKLA